jgi:hypothetical protein
MTRYHHAPVPRRPAWPRPALPLLIVLLTALAPPAQALDYQLHGFAAQGFSLSENNNYYGDSTGGSTDFYELGLNGTVSLLPQLLLSAQGLMRRAGSTDTESLRLDYAQLDYRFLSSSRYEAGLRLGRVKNPFGFYNDTRDVVFTRPGITLPDAVYLDSDGVRSVLFSRDGGQLYGGAQFGNHYLSLEANYAAKTSLSDKERRQIFGGLDLPVEIELEHFRAARLQDEWNGGTVRLALSYLHCVLAVDPNPSSPILGHLDADLAVASAQYNNTRFAITGEYRLLWSASDTSLAPPQTVVGDGFYLQGEYRLLPHWTLLGRYSASFVDRNDREGRAYAAQTGADRFSRFAHDETLGLNWQPSQHWGLWAEYHQMQGSATVPVADNIGRTPADHWNLFQLMAGYRF